jgi:hypothetical protein
MTQLVLSCFACSSAFFRSRCTLGLEIIALGVEKNWALWIPNNAGLQQNGLWPVPEGNRGKRRVAVDK